MGRCRWLNWLSVDKEGVASSERHEVPQAQGQPIQEALATHIHGGLASGLLEAGRQTELLTCHH